MSQLTDCHKQRITRLITVLKIMNAKFDMGLWFYNEKVKLTPRGCVVAEAELLNDCGTSCCIGGTAAAIFNPSTEEAMSEEAVAEVLGLDDAGLEALFYPEDEFSKVGRHVGRSFMRATNPGAAVQVLQHYHDTGEVDWHQADHYYAAHPDEEF